MLQMRTAARMRPHAVDSSELSSFRTQTLARKHYLPRDPRLGGILLAFCDLAVFAAVMMLVAMLLAPASADLFTTSWPHFALTGVLSFIVVHSLARSYDLTGAVHASLFDFVIKPAVLTCAATTFSYGVEAWLRHSTIDGAAFGPGQLSPEHYVIVFATLAMAGERLLGYGLLNRWQAAGHLSTSVVVFGADAIGQRLVKVVREDYADSVSVVGVFDDRVQRVPGHVQGIPVDGGIDALIEFVKSTPAVDKVTLCSRRTDALLSFTV